MRSRHDDTYTHVKPRRHDRWSVILKSNDESNSKIDMSQILNDDNTFKFKTGVDVKVIRKYHENSHSPVRTNSPKLSKFKANTRLMSFDNSNSNNYSMCKENIKKEKINLNYLHRLEVKCNEVSNMSNEVLESINTVKRNQDHLRSKSLFDKKAFKKYKYNYDKYKNAYDKNIMNTYINDMSILYEKEDVDILKNFNKLKLNKKNTKFINQLDMELTNPDIIKRNEEKHGKYIDHTDEKILHQSVINNLSPVKGYFTKDSRGGYKFISFDQNILQDCDRISNTNETDAFKFKKMIIDKFDINGTKKRHVKKYSEIIKRVNVFPDNYCEELVRKSDFKLLNLNNKFNKCNEKYGINTKVIETKKFPEFDF